MLRDIELRRSAYGVAGIKSCTYLDSVVVDYLEMGEATDVEGFPAAVVTVGECFASHGEVPMTKGTRALEFHVGGNAAAHGFLSIRDPDLQLVTGVR